MVQFRVSLSRPPPSFGVDYSSFMAMVWTGPKIAGEMLPPVHASASCAPGVARQIYVLSLT